MSDYDPDANAFGCHAVAIAASREMKIRSGELKPLPDDPNEQRWAEEGPVPVAQLESGRPSS